MSYPTQKDYGGEPQLVPEGLRVYRHFRMSHDGFAPTIANADLFEAGVNSAKCYAAPHARARRKCPMCQGDGRVRRVSADTPDVSDYIGNDGHRYYPTYFQNIEVEDCECLAPDCDAPNRACACGFYASYDPALNFFDEHRQNVGGPGVYLNLPNAFGVVEMSGRVLMGSKGVRAQRMRIVAMTVDVQHIMASVHAHFDPIQANYDVLRTLGGVYGIEVFASIPDMIKAYPQPDLSHLIKDQNHG